MKIKLEIITEVNEDSIIIQSPSLGDHEDGLLDAISEEVEIQLMNDEYMTIYNAIVWKISKISGDK